VVEQVGEDPVDAGRDPAEHRRGDHLELHPGVADRALEQLEGVVQRGV
jgi:hypothetical protein